jgi:hypothetical protein
VTDIKDLKEAISDYQYVKSPPIAHLVKAAQTLVEIMEMEKKYPDDGHGDQDDQNRGHNALIDKIHEVFERGMR